MKLTDDVVRKAMREAFMELFHDVQTKEILEGHAASAIEKACRKQVEVSVKVNPDTDAGLFDISVSVKESVEFNF